MLRVAREVPRNEPESPPTTQTESAPPVTSTAAPAVVGHEWIEADPGSPNLLRALRTLGRANRALVHARDEATLLQDTCRTIIDADDYLVAWVGFAQHDEDKTVLPVAAAGRVESLDDIRVTWADNAAGQGPIGIAIRTGNVQARGDLASALTTDTNRAAALKHGIRSACVLPLHVGDEVIGTLSIHSAIPDALARRRSSC